MHFVIAGSINCSRFTYAVMVAQRLKENLPDFTYLKIALKPEEYRRWLKNTCQENHWYHVESPIIWREIGLKKGKKYFIGDINKFLDMCYDYYGIPQDILSGEQFNREEIKWFTKSTETEYFERVKLEAKQRRRLRSRQVCITGAASPIAELIIMELLQIERQRRENGLEIRLFDDPTKDRRLSGEAEDAKCCPGASGFGNCRVANTLKDALFNIDLVIVLDTFTRKANETLVKWLKRNRNAMCALGKALNKYAPPHCRVILGGPSSQPLCYNATVLASFATKLHVRNIVAVTHDLGRQMLKFLSLKANVPLKNFYCPPVWGFVGLNKFVDIPKTLINFLYKVPGKRMKSNLPQGTEEYQLRTCECLLDDESEGELHKTVAGQRAEIFPQLGRMPYLAKATAIIDLLKIWGIKQEDGNGEIMSLGVYSDGTFNIPRGIYWSQPVILSNGFWMPFPEFPIPRSPYLNYYYLFMFSVASLYRTKIKPRIYIPHKKKTVAKEKRKFNFDKMAEAIGMPVIRTDVECVAYLKYLTKTELGVDLDAVDDFIEEEDEGDRVRKDVIPLEEEDKPRIYCECWRQELKDLQKVVFEHSSTTEIEVDLSENVSGSEWPVINVPSKTRADTSISQKDSGKNMLSTEPGKQSEDMESVSSASTVCSCGVLPTGSECKCLAHRTSKKDKESAESERISTEHFYKEQNAEIFDEDLKDVIYEDTFPGNKHTAFDKDSKSEDGVGGLAKLYGIADAIRDPNFTAKMEKRMLRYERGSELSSEEDEKPGETVKGEGEAVSVKSSEKKSSSADLAADQEEDETEIPSSMSRKESSITFEGELPLEIQPFSYGKSEEKIERRSEIYYQLTGEQTLSSAESFKTVPRLPEEEKSVDEYSSKSLEEDLFALWGESQSFEGLFDEGPKEEGEEEEEEEEQQTEKKPRKRRMRDGIPLCCLCRCVIPEGLSICPCGENTVVEVFKKESVEVFIQNEDDIDYLVEYLDKKASFGGVKLRPRIQSYGPYEGEAGEELDAKGKKSDRGKFRSRESDESFRESEDYGSFGGSRDFSRLSEEARRTISEDFVWTVGSAMKRRKYLPPESFFPFHPRPENKFKESVRPTELTKEYLESLDKKETEIPAKCLEFFNMAKGILEDHSMMGEDEEYEYEGDQELEREEHEREHGEPDEGLPPICEMIDQIKTDFSDLKMFVPCGLEDWRVTVQKKYKEWFFRGPKIKDETYYDVAVEDISEDEFEIDEELEKFFES